MKQSLIGRTKEKEELLDLFYSERPEFVVLYGRRRVGKTFLVNSLFENDLAFRVTAVLNEDTHEQLRTFALALTKYGREEEQVPADWITAFERLRVLLEKSNRKRKVVFIDELPWFDTKDSYFISALEHFWNGWASTRDDIMLIACGSATSWIVKKLFRSRGGLHNRVTRRILLQQFTLSECRQYAELEGLPSDEISLLEIYMTFGGIPYYLRLLNKNQGLAQNISRLCFSPDGELRDEFDNLYASLFKNATRHLLVVEALGKKKSGLTREEIKEATKLPEGGGLSEVLDELQLSGFIRKYSPFSKKKKGALYQLVDHFTLFHLAFIAGSPDHDRNFWMKKQETQSYKTWRGYAFEQVCLAHVESIQKAIGVSGVITQVASWKSEKSSPGTQVDLLINRNDRVISLCEMKFSDSELALTKKQSEELRKRRNVFIEETGTTRAVHIVLVTPIGLSRNTYYDTVQAVITLRDLLKD